jgi:hypothetical protein
MKAIAQIVLLNTVLSFSGCVTLYKPNTVYSPLLKEKGEANASASVGLSGNGLFNVQAAYAVSNHAAILIDGMYHNRQKGDDKSSVEKLTIFSGEVGAGYFNTMGTNRNTLFQCYAGGGYGTSTDKIENSDQTYPEVSARYFNVFVQPGVALITKDNLELAFDVRANYVHMYDINAFLYDQFDWWNTDFQYYADTTLNFVNMEPTVTIRIGGKNLKGTFQLGTILPAINSEAYYDVNTVSRLGISLVKIYLGLVTRSKTSKNDISINSKIWQRSYILM